MHFLTTSLLALALGLQAGQASAASSSASGCLPTPVPSPTPSPAYRCNSQGTLSRPSLSTTFHARTSDYTSCYTACLAASDCQSFAYSSSTGSCATYNQTLVKQGFATSTTSGTSYWSLPGCFKLPASCTSSTPTPSNVVVDGSFEKNPSTAWTVQSTVCGGGRAQDGNCAAQMIVAVNARTGDSVFTNQTLTGLTPGKAYAITFYYAVTNFQTNSESIYLALIMNDDNSPFFQELLQTTNGYVKVGPLSYKAEAASEVMSFLLGGSSVPYNVTMLLDNVSMVG